MLVARSIINYRPMVQNKQSIFIGFMVALPALDMAVGYARRLVSVIQRSSGLSNFPTSGLLFISIKQITREPITRINNNRRCQHVNGIMDMLYQQ
jgi:hypothetical protein